VAILDFDTPAGPICRMNSSVTIENRPFRARLLVLFWMVEIGVGLAFAAAGAARMGSGENGVAGVMIAGGVLLSIVGVIMAAISWRIARIRGPVLTLGPSGLMDRRICEQVIPWSAVSWKIIFNGRAYALQFDVAEPERSSLDPYWEQQAIGKFNSLFRYPEFSVAALGTGRTIYDLADIMKRYKAPSEGAR
jgi:hypothetical protein